MFFIKVTGLIGLIFLFITATEPNRLKPNIFITANEFNKTYCLLVEINGLDRAKLFH